MATQTGLRERKKEQTRAALQAAALRLTAAHGLDGVTVEDIATAADVSVRTFFNYFSCKEEAVIAVEPAWLAEVAAVIASRPADEEPLRSIQAVLHGLAERITESRALHALRRQVLADNPALLPRQLATFVEFERVLVRALTARKPTPGRPSDRTPAPGLVVAAAVAAMRVSVDDWASHAGESSLTALLDEAIDHLACGLTAPATTASPGPASVRHLPPTPKDSA